MAMVPIVFSGMTTSRRRVRCLLRVLQSENGEKKKRFWLRPRAISSNIECRAELGREGPSDGEPACPRYSQTSPARAFPQDPDQGPREINAGTISDRPASRRRINTVLRDVS